jgi:hypothetical protein
VALVPARGLRPLFGLYFGGQDDWPNPETQVVCSPMSRAEITTPEVLSDESVVELSLRPQRLEEFIGQQKV